MTGKILVVDDEKSMCDMIQLDLSKRDFDVTTFTNAEHAFECMKNKIFDVIITDIQMPGMDGISFCERVVSNFPETLVIVTTAFGSLETAVAAMRSGAYDFITKPFEMDVLALTLGRAVKHSALKQQIKFLSEETKKNQRFDGLIGESKVIHEVFDSITRLANSDASVLITGESGTGKGLVANAIHKSSSRNKGPFVVLNCAALPESLLESELFGHVRGAFTDARNSRRGLILEANHGTLFLDEIGEMPQKLQPKLLRILEEQKIRPVGGEREIDVDVRILAATNKDLESEVEDRNFREDLYFRINVVQLEMKPLKSRITDIPILANHFLFLFSEKSGKEITGFTEQSIHKLVNYNWPGNVRELKNTVERAVVLSQTNQIIVEDLPEKIRAYQNNDLFIAGNNPSELVSIDEIEKRYILHVFKTLGENRSLTARTLGLDRKTLYRKLQKYSGK